MDARCCICDEELYLADTGYAIYCIDCIDKIEEKEAIK